MMTKRKKGWFKMIYLFIAFVVGLALYIHLEPKLSKMHEGQWQITMETKLPEAQNSIPVTSSQCLTRAAPVPDFIIPDYTCRLRRKRYPYHVLGSFVFCRIQCEGPIPIQGEGYIRYQGDTLKGKIQMRTLEEQGKGQKSFKIIVSGFRTGECK